MIKRIENNSHGMVFEYKFTIPFDNDIDLCINEKVEEFRSELSLILNMRPQKDFEKVEEFRSELSLILNMRPQKDFEKKEKNEIVRNLKKIMRGK